MQVMITDCNCVYSFGYLCFIPALFLRVIQ